MLIVCAIVRMSTTDPNEALRRHFAFERFRPPQDEVVDAILNRRDTLVIMPTGGGKSLCYQLPALLLPHVTLVVSPLIALMKDQVDALRAKGLPAALLNSTQTAAEQRETLEAMAQGKLKLVYVAPERFRSRAFMGALSRITVSLFAVDEAHCLSQWGHDFRPDYLRLGAALQHLGHPPVAAFTATATPDVREDIRKHLALRDPAVFVSGFARPNLSFKVVQTSSEDEKYRFLHSLIRTHRKGIVYCATRKRVESVAANLETDGFSALAYHGGMDDRERERIQNAFMRKESDLVVATNAFGMGIDRNDLRFVLHFEMPGSVEAYYQEAGRAGRDGLASECLFLFNFADKRTQEFFIEGRNPEISTVRAVYDTLRSAADNSHEVLLSIDDLTERLPGKVNPIAVSTAIAILGRHGCLERFDVPGKRIRGTRLLRPEVSALGLELDAATLAKKRQADEARLRSVIQYAYEHNTCRQQWILRYFGDRDLQLCGECDVCRADRAENHRPGDDNESLIARKALSGVARMCDRLGDREWRPRFGRARIIQCLLGSNAAPIRQAGLDQLSTHGLLKAEGKDYLNALFREFERAGFVYTTDGDYPLLGLTDAGARVMQGEAPCTLAWPERDAPARKSRTPDKSGRTPDASSAPPDADLLTKLKQKRSELAAARGGQPAYVILTNHALEELARRRPARPEEALDIPGIGEAKVKKIIPTFLKIIHKHEASVRHAARPDPAGP